MTIVSRAYNKFSTLPFGLIQKESVTDRLADEINYYRIIHADPKKAILFPRLVTSEISKPNKLVIEKYDYRTLGDLLLLGYISNWHAVFSQLSAHLRYMASLSGYIDGGRSRSVSNAMAMYITKTGREFDAFVKADHGLPKELFSNNPLVITGETYKNFPTIWEEVTEFITSRLSYDPAMIHGDFCLSNILYGTDVFKFIDPRGSFGDSGILGDRRYDVAKLYHSVDGKYEYFINDEFYIEQNSPVDYNLFFYKEEYANDAADAFETIFFNGEFDKKEIMMIAGCIFIGMCARHFDSQNRQLGMYLTGVRILNEALEL